jgi:hypothetical protein
MGRAMRPRPTSIRHLVQTIPDNQSSEGLTIMVPKIRHLVAIAACLWLMAVAGLLLETSFSAGTRSNELLL